MYEKHFGLKSRPFRSRTDASGVFVGPAQVKLISSLKKAFAASDAIVTVTGPVGVGKSTVVNRALEGIGTERIVAQVGRMQLASDEVLELLLTEFDVSRQPTGTIQRFAAFKRLLHGWADAGTRAFIIVEDADRIGIDALIELEALTASDSGDGAGAGIVLMGQPGLADRIAHPDLARLRQRIRLRHAVTPFSAVETQGYLKHCIRNAGGEFDSVFDPAAADMLYRCSEGIPRVINNLCESVLAAAAEAGATLVLPQLVQHIAHEEFGLQPASRTVEREPAAPPVKIPPAAVTAVEVASKAPDTTDADIERPKVKAPPNAAAIAEAKSKAGAGKPAAKPVVPQLKDEAADAGAEEPALPDGFEPIAVSAFSAEPETRPMQKAAPVVAPEKSAAQAVLPEAPPLPDEVPTLAEPAAADDADPVMSVADSDTSALAREPDDDVPALEDIPDWVSEEPSALQAIADIPELQPDEPSAPAALEDIPELIQDTQPGLAALHVDDDLPDLTDLVVPGPASPPKRAAVSGQADAKAGPMAGSRSKADIPTLSGDLRIDKKPEAPAPVLEKPAAPVIDELQDEEDPKSEATITEIPSWDRDPTLAELKPDLAALEAELAVVVPEPPAKTAASSKPAPQPEKKPAKPASSFDLPEITLEKELQVKEIEAQESLRKAGRPETHEADVDAPVKRKHGFDLDKIAAELGKARSLEDVDDRLAETLFGEEMANAAAEVAAMVAANEPDSPLAGAALELLNDVEPPAKAPTAANPPKAPPAKPEAAAKAASGQTPAKAPAVARVAVPEAPPVEITLQSRPDPEPPQGLSTPEPIEEQFGTSMTATLKALSAAQVQGMDESANDEEDEEEEKPARKLFGLFKSGN